MGRFLALAIAVLFAVTVFAGMDDLDLFGNLPASAPGTAPPVPPSDALGDVLNSFPAPLSAGGLAFRSDRLWFCNGATLTEIDPDTGAISSTLAITPTPGSAIGLGYDSSRDLFVTVDLVSSTLLTVDPTTGAVQSSFATPASGCYGIDYDSTRDGYWTGSFNTNQLYLVDATTGALISTCGAGGGSRLAGTAYAMGADRVLYNSRDNATTYIMEASDCATAVSFTTPPGPGSNNGQGITYRPSTTDIYILGNDTSTIYVVDSDGTVPVTLTSFSVD